MRSGVFPYGVLDNPGVPVGNQGVSAEYQRQKEAEKGQTFKEWFLYTRYREEIPKFFLVLYFLILFVHGAALVACLVLHAVGPFPEMGRKIAIGVYVFDGAWMLLMQLLFWSSKPGMPYARWVKKRGMPPKKRK